MELEMALTESVDKIMTFAEILYKCTLCTTLPSILTSKASFVSHVKVQHFNKSQNKCPVCSLTFETEEDLHAHASSTHKPDFTTTIKCEPEDNFHSVTLKEKGEEGSCYLSSNRSVLESTQMGHKISNNILSFSENYHKDDVKNRNEIPEERLSFQQEYSMQNIGHSEKSESINTENHPKVNIEYGIESAPHNHLQNDMSKIQALTNHILAVNSKDKTSAYVHDFSPSFTPEFGNYTKLIREGGNIAYFCQVCNWKSQIKSHFHTHCQDKVHKEKLKHAENKSSEKACVDRPRVSKERIGKTDDEFEISEPTSNESSDPISKSLGNNESSPMKQFQEKARERQNKRKRSVLVSLRNQSSDRGGWDSSDSDQSKGSENDVVVHSPGKKKYARSQILEKISKKSENEQENKRELTSNYVDLSLNLSDSDNLNLKSKEVLDISNFSSQERFNVSSSNLQADADSANVPYDLYKDIHNQILWNLVGQNQQKSDSTQSSHLFYRDQNQPPPPPPTASSFMTDSEKFNPCKFLYRCSLCTFGCNKIQQYRKHFEIQHEQTAVTAETSSYIYSEGKETWKVNKIKEFLPDLICIFPKGNVSRDLLLQKISSFGQIPEAIHWGPACNKAVREIFPDTLAQRKGKFKKYFFGVSFIEHMQETEEVSDPEVMQYQPLRDMSQDLEKILEHLDTILEPSRDDTCSVSRDDVLSILHKRIDEPDVPYWGMQCNRAIRIIYPSVVIKRKGKFKTVFQGVDFCEEVKHELKNLPTSAASVNKKGRPRKMYAEDFPIELYHRGMSWTDAIRTGHSESYKKYSNIHIPRPHTASSDPVKETRGWGPTVNLANDALEESRFTKSPNNPQSICQNVRGEGNKLLYDKKSIVNHMFDSSEFMDENHEIRYHERNDNMQGHSGSREFIAPKNWTECAFKAKYKDQDLYISVNNDDESDDIDDDSDDDADDEESLCHSIEDKDAEESVSQKHCDKESVIDVCQKHGDRKAMGSFSQKHRDNEDMGSVGHKRQDNEDMRSVGQKRRDNEGMDCVENKIDEEETVEGASQNIAKNEAEEVIIDNVN